MRRTRDEQGVGYGRPPENNKFKKGTSGNPKGRPRKSQTAGEVVAKILGETVPITISGKLRRVSLIEAAFRKTISLAFSSPNPKYLEKIIQLIEKYGVQAQRDDAEKSREAAQTVLNKIFQTFDRIVPDDPESVQDQSRREQEELEIIKSCACCSDALYQRWKREKGSSEGFLPTWLRERLFKRN